MVKRKILISIALCATVVKGAFGVPVSADAGAYNKDTVSYSADADTVDSVSVKNNIENEKNVYGFDPTEKYLNFPEKMKKNIFESKAHNAKYLISGKDTVTYISPIYRPEGKVITIHDSVKYNGVNYRITGIGYKAFYRTQNVRKLVIGKNVETIGEDAFFTCKQLRKIVFGDNVKTIKCRAFGNSIRLTKVSLPKELTKIDDRAFANCKKLKSVKFEGDKLKKICGFDRCKVLRDIVLPDSVECIESFGFWGSGLERIELPQNLNTIERYAFVGTKLKEITIPDSVSYIGVYAFELSQIEKVTLGKGIKQLHGLAFLGNPLKEVNILYENDVKYHHIEDGKYMFCGAFATNKSDKIVFNVPGNKIDEYKELFSRKNRKKVNQECARYAGDAFSVDYEVIINGLEQ